MPLGPVEPATAAKVEAPVVGCCGWKGGKRDERFQRRVIEPCSSMRRPQVLCISMGQNDGDPHHIDYTKVGFGTLDLFSPGIGGPSGGYCFIMRQQ